MGNVRTPAVAGSWYPGSAPELAAALDLHLSKTTRDLDGDLVALVAPHAGLMYSGPVAAHAYRLLRGRAFDVAVLVGPSHFVGFDGVSIYRGGGFESPFGIVAVEQECADMLVTSTTIVHDAPRVHAREHSLEMQIPFLQHVAPGVPIVPLLMGHQTAATAQELADALTTTLRGRRALIVASTDLSHYHDATTAAALDGVVIDCVERFDADSLQAALETRPDHACGGGPTVAVMRTARALGARDAVILHYADSGDVSGDKSAVVGYLAAAFGTFTQGSTTEDTDVRM